MTKEEFEKCMADDAEFLKWDRVESRRSQRPDLHAFLLLDELQPGNRDMVCAAEHDEFWLGINVERLAEVITSEQCIELQRCGSATMKARNRWRFSHDLPPSCRHRRRLHREAPDRRRRTHARMGRRDLQAMPGATAQDDAEDEQAADTETDEEVRRDHGKDTTRTPQTRDRIDRRRGSEHQLVQ